MAEKAYLQLKELGSKLETVPTSKDSLIKLLKQATTCLAELDQSPLTSTLDSMKPFFNAIVKPELLKHQDRDVKLLVATCICEITRITAPEAPYSDEILKDTFRLIVSTFSGLSDTSGPSFGRRVVILETLAKYRSCVVMLDLECDDLVNEMFCTFLAVARDDHPESVLSSMQTIMVVLLEESEDVSENLLSILLSALGRGKNGVTMAARRLAMNVIQQLVGKLEPSIKQFLLSLMSGDSKLVNSQIGYHGIIYDLYCCAPQILSGVLPYVTGELLMEQLETRLKAMNLVGDIISLPGTSIPEAFQPIFSEFLKRLSDRVVEVRMSALEHVKNCLLSNPFRAEAPQIISALCERLLDFDENIRKQAVAVICDVTSHTVNAIPLETVKLVAERLRDKSLLVKKYTMERLAEVYKVFCEKKNNCNTVNPDEYDWIVGKIVRCFYDKDFRSEIIESVLCGSLFPVEFSISDLVKHWVGIFSVFDKVEVKALEKIMEQKQRLQQEMQKYLSLRKMHQDKRVPEVQKKILFCFRVMSRAFSDPTKAEESFQILNQLKDANIWKILTNLVDPNTSLRQARAYRDELLKILGEKHRLYEFLNTFYVKCSYLLFNKEYVKEILVETVAQKSAENAQRTQSFMNLLVIIARYCPLLFSGSEEDLVNLLKDNNDVIKEGILNVLANAGATIREQLAVTSSSVDLILERLCLEGSRRQAKYAVYALAAITRDDGLKSLSVLYKKLVDLLEDKTHLPAVLQSLGCIAQTAMPVFETRETEIKEFITNKILRSDSKEEDRTRTSWDDKSDLCMLKIYGIKTLVKSYLPVKDAHLRPDIDSLLDILRNILSYGEISKDLQSSSADKVHLRLASAKAVLRLSRQWDQKIPVDIFHLTLKAPEISFPQAKKMFLSKVHQYIKDRFLDAKYACAFLFNIFESKPHEFAEDKQNLADIIQMHYQAKARQISVQSDANSLTIYPEYILPYLVHTLAHNSCPNVDECKDVGAYDNIYRQLHLLLAMLLQRDEGGKSEQTTEKEKEIISTITSIFQSLKLSEDMVDSSKAKNSHAICDLGLAIMKKLVPKDVDLQELSHLVSLPTMLYKTYEKMEGDDTMASEVKSWLADDAALNHFESLELEMVQSQVPENEASMDNQEDENEIPLVKMLKRIKSQGISGKKVKKIKSVPGETKKVGNDFDMLNMVRQINMDNMGLATNAEANNGHEHSLSKEKMTDPEQATRPKRKIGETNTFPLPKRGRSSAHEKLRLSTSTLKSSRRVSGENSPKPNLLLDAEIDSETDSKTMQSLTLKDLLVSSLKQKVKGSESYHNDDLNKHDERDMKSHDDLKQSEKTASNNSKSSIRSTKKSKKRKSIAGLTKCKAMEGETDTDDLIGCRIKVWWPSDKKFYGGTIKSYDPTKRKHVILYDDGDVEILRLEKECWELIDKGRKSTKKKKLSSLDNSGQKGKDSSGSASKRRKKIVNGKPSPSKPVNHGQKLPTKSYFYQEDAKKTSEMSNPEETMTTKADEMNSGDFAKEELTGGSDQITTKGKKSTKKVKSVSRGKSRKKNKSFGHVEESDEEKEDFSERLSEAPECVLQCSSEEKEGDESTEALRENVSGEEESDSKGHQKNSDVGLSTEEIEKSYIEPSSPDDASTAEISDDVPLSQWKRRTGKKGLGKTRLAA